VSDYDKSLHRHDEKKEDGVTESSVMCGTVYKQIHIASKSSKFFYRATLRVSAVFAIAWCLSVCHVGALYPDGWRYHWTSSSAR